MSGPRYLLLPRDVAERIGEPELAMVRVEWRPPFERDGGKLTAESVWYRGRRLCGKATLPETEQEP